VKIIIVLFTASFIYSSGLLAEEYSLLPEVVQKVPLSSTDVNRVNCKNGAITDVVFSKEKGIEVKQSGSNAYIKYTIKVVGNQEQYIQRPTEFHIVCDEEIYTLIAEPRPGGPVIVRLSNNERNRLKRNVEKAKGIPKEQLIVTLSKQVLTQDYDPGHRVQKQTEEIRLFNEVVLTKITDVHADGWGMKASEYLIVAKKDLQKINEREFLNTKLGNKIIGVTVHPQSLKKNEKARVIIINEVNQ